MLNQQSIEKRSLDSDYVLDVHGIFYTIQGEGPFCGTPATFIRLAGCNLQCPWCDTEYTQGRKQMTTEAISAEVQRLQPKGGLVVITGGEPFRQNLKVLIPLLMDAGYYVQVETNGTLPPSHIGPGPTFGYSTNPTYRYGAYIVCSPKAGRVNPEIWQAACCVKYVLDHENMVEEDGLPRTALGHRANPHVARQPSTMRLPVYLQPADHKNTEHNWANVRAVVKSAKEHNYIVQLQIHKLLEVE